MGYGRTEGYSDRPRDRHVKNYRDRSRSPREYDRRRDDRPYERRRSRSRDIGGRGTKGRLEDTNGRYSRGRDRRRSTSRDRNRDRSPARRSQSLLTDKNGLERPSTFPGEDHLEPSQEVDEDAEMMKSMGFAGFSSTQGKHIPGNSAGVIKKVKPQRFRQYMNRPGGFNKPLSNY